MPDEEIIKSGLLGEWVDSLSDISAIEMRGIMASIAQIPMKTCDALIGCSMPAVWWVDFHGCDGEAACDQHKKDWVWEVVSALGQQGVVPCPDCNQSFSNMGDIMTWRVI